MLIEYVFLIIILIICIAGLFHFWSLISFRKAKERIDKLTIDDFYVEKQDIIKYLDVKDVDRLFEVRKDKNGEIYYFVNGVLYSYGNTHRLSLSITDSDSWERTYRIKQKQYEDFMDYIDGIDKIEVVCKEIKLICYILPDIALILYNQGTNKQFFTVFSLKLLTLKYLFAIL